MADQDLHSVAFHRLDPSQMGMLDTCGGATLKKYRDGQTLIQAGMRDFKFFVVKSGAVAILDDSETPRQIATLGPGEFTGDVAHLTGGSSLITAVARGDCEVYEVSAQEERKLVYIF